MLFELIATLFAGLGAAGLALIARKLTAQRIPAWTIPVCAGLGMFGFQIYSEYTWLDHQMSLLPQGVILAKTMPETKAWKPWTYLYPQRLRFLAVDSRSLVANKINPQVVLADVYAFERRHSARRIPQVFHCVYQARAMLSEELRIPAVGESLDDQWIAAGAEDPLVQIACSQYAADDKGKLIAP